MKHLRLMLPFLLVLLAFACFLSVPVLSNDEDPWDADDGGGDAGSNTDTDTTVTDDQFECQAGFTGGYGIRDWLIGLTFRSSYPFVVGYLLNTQIGPNKYQTTVKAE